MLIVWAVLTLEEMSLHSTKVFDALDDWIVISVKQENELCQAAVKELRNLIV